MKVSQNKKSTRMPSGGSVVTQVRTTSNESLRKYEQDIETLLKRIADLNGTGPELTSSPFVTGLRSSVEGNRGGNEEETTILQLQTVEDLLSRVVELDRLVLKKTDGAIKARSRRGSRGADLITIPTHLLLIDRLMDLYAISQRPAIVQSNTSSPDLPPPDNNELNLRVAEVARLSKSLAESDAAKIKLQDTLNKKVEELEALKTQHKAQLLQGRDEGSRSPRGNVSPRPARSLTVVGSGTNVIPVSDPNISRLEKENADLKGRLSAADQQRRVLEERCEVAAAAHQSSLAAVNSLTDRFKQKGADVDFVALSDGAANGVPPDTKRALELLLSAISHFASEWQSTSTYRSSAEMTALSKENQSLREDLSVLREESARQLTQLQHTCEKMAAEHEEGSLKDMRYIAELEKRSEEYQVSGREAKIELAALRAQMAQTDKYPAKIALLQSQLLDTDDRRVALEGRVAECVAEIDALQALVRSLKEKMKTMSGSDDRRDFADTFEEVMREEMMAMKVAFESKLRIARDEAEAASRRHQLEIKKVSTTSPLGIAL